MEVQDTFMQAERAPLLQGRQQQCQITAICLHVQQQAFNVEAYVKALSVI